MAPQDGAELVGRNKPLNGLTLWMKKNVAGHGQAGPALRRCNRERDEDSDRGKRDQRSTLLCGM